MTKQEFKDILKELQLARKEFAWLLGISPFTIRDWFRPSRSIPLTVQHVLRAWKCLNMARIPWRPMQKKEEAADDQAGS